MTFTGDAVGNALALRTSDGATLWHSAIGRVGNGPMTYELDGRQYVLVAAAARCTPGRSRKKQPCRRRNKNV